MTRVVFQGERGAYSEEAIHTFFGHQVTTLAVHGFANIFEVVKLGEAAFGMLPIENSTAGSVNQAYDLLLEHDLVVWGEVLLRVRHALLAPDGEAQMSIKTVRSHPQALAQCARYLVSHGYQAQAVYDTAGSARELASSPEQGVAAIASRLAGRIYGLAELDYGIEDSADNYTRFFVLSNSQPEREECSKTSVVFATQHVPGALYEAMGEFADRGINLTKLESRPMRDRPWHYVFYLDFEGHVREEPCSEALDSLQRKALFLKVLGSYPAARMPASRPA